jgi:thiol peroxidase
MAKITLGGTAIETSGELPSRGSVAPDFRLTREDLSDASLSDFSGKIKILNIVPSLDTGVCAASARRFDSEVSKLDSVVLLTISNDLPFAMSRFCKAEGLANVISLSQLRDRNFGKDWGVSIVSGPLEGLLSRLLLFLMRKIALYTANRSPR